MRSLTISTPTTANPPNQSPSFSEQHRSPWHTSIPYLFGGLSAMLGLIAFALFLLACSYCRENNNNNNNNEESDVEKDAESVKTPKIFVVMAGDNMPSFIATPMGKAALFGDDNKEKT